MRPSVSQFAAIPDFSTTVLSDADKNLLVDRYLRPQPRLGLVEALRKHASAALDISDGLLKDLARLSGPLGLELKLEDAAAFGTCTRGVGAAMAALPIDPRWRR